MPRKRVKYESQVIQVKDESQSWKSRMTASQGWKSRMKCNGMKVTGERQGWISGTRVKDVKK